MGLENDMERLTEKHYGGDGYYMACSATCDAEDADCERCGAMDAILNRLGAYEDTGLMPEEVTAEVSANAAARVFVEKMTDFGSTEAVKRLRELAEADMDGRVVVLPCNVGDSVNLIYQGRIIECIAEFVNIGMVSGNKVVACALTDRADQYGVTFNAFGKTAFLTRETAEKALKEAKGDG